MRIKELVEYTKKELIKEFVNEYDDFLEVINGIMFQLGFQGIKISDELRLKWKDIQNRREKWEDKLK